MWPWKLMVELEKQKGTCSRLYQALCIISKPSVNSNSSYSPVPCHFEIWRINLKNNRAPLLCYLKLCASFHSHQRILTGVTVRKRPVWVKIDVFCPLWPWNLTDDIEKHKSTSPKKHQAVSIISSSYVNSSWSYSPETANLGYDPCDLDFWPITLTFCMDITSVIGNNFWQFCDDTVMGT